MLQMNKSMCDRPGMQHVVYVLDEEYTSLCYNQSLFTGMINNTLEAFAIEYTLIVSVVDACN